MLPLIRLVIAGVFALAGITKLLDPSGTRQSLRDFGVSEGLTPAGAVALPGVELAVALALLPAATARAGAIGAALLLVVFLGAIGVNLVRGLRPDCHCFGQLHSEPIGWRVVARNLVLLLASVAVVALGGSDGGGSLIVWTGALPLLVRLLVVGSLATVAVLAVRQLARRPEPKPPTIPDFSAHALPIGAPAPAFSVPRLGDGALVTLRDLLAPGKPVLLTSIAPTCGPCQDVLPHIARWQHDFADRLTIVTITTGTEEDNLSKLAQHPVGLVLRQSAREVAEAFGLVVTPSAILVNADGTIGRTPAIGDAAVLLYAEDIASGAPAVATRHMRAPEFGLPDLAGHVVTLSQQTGTATVLLFWDPACAFCLELLGHVRLWEARPRDQRPNLLAICCGAVDQADGLGLQSTVLIDRGFTTGSRYGLAGTPAAVLVDASGVIASDPAMGAEAIMELLEHPLPPVVSAACPPEDEAITTDAVRSQGSRLERGAWVRDEPLADGSLLLYNACRKQVMTLNPTGAYVWECCDGAHDVRAIAADLGTLFPAAAATVEQDVWSIIDSLLRAGLLSLPEAGGAKAPVTADLG